MPLIQIELNGKSRPAATTQSLEDLIASLDLAGKSLAVSINREVVKRAEWPNRHLQADDKIEIVHAIGGG
ncbi:thiamine biosynthesis protein ThiS [Parazoarcus communis]|uniref:Thiamine biosynthesis protein ThiS n=1 Tax=Parazoarcus communis TaxID=41977 RepID=A0A2U8H466_9RHOO|nr:sulfur carrier protein ThiS [Parazoarcus communis]AWI80722.1 thiamine biosynthesis protein ThiS [Parazoarcus communis]